MKKTEVLIITLTLEYPDNQRDKPQIITTFLREFIKSYNEYSELELNMVTQTEVKK